MEISLIPELEKVINEYLINYKEPLHVNCIRNYKDIVYLIIDNGSLNISIFRILPESRIMKRFVSICPQCLSWFDRVDVGRHEIFANAYYSRHYYNTFVNILLEYNEKIIQMKVCSKECGRELILKYSPSISSEFSNVIHAYISKYEFNKLKNFYNHY